MLPFGSDVTQNRNDHIPPFDWLMPLAPWEDPAVLSETLNSLKQQTLQAELL